MQKLFEMSPSVVLPTKQDFDDISALINTKADASAVEALGTEVAKKANASDVEALGTRVGKVEGDVTALGTSKADASAVAAIDTRLGTAEGTIATLGTTVSGKIGWDVSTAGTPFTFDKDGNKISFLTGDNLTVGADGKLDIAQSVVTALNSIGDKLDKTAIGDGLTLAEVDGAEKLTLNYNSNQLEIDDGGQLSIKAGTFLTPASVANGPDMPYHITDDNSVKILTDINSGIYTTTITTTDADSGEEITGYGLTIDTSVFYSKLVVDHGFLTDTSLVQEYNFETLEGVFNAVKAIAEKLGGTVVGWPVEATA